MKRLDPVALEDIDARLRSGGCRLVLGNRRHAAHHDDVEPAWPGGHRFRRRCRRLADVRTASRSRRSRPRRYSPRGGTTRGVSRFTLYPAPLRGSACIDPCSVSGAPIIAADGSFVGYRGIGRDRTGEALAVEHAATAHLRLVDAIESIPESFALLDRDDQLLMCNSRFREEHRPVAEWLVPGTRFEDIRRAGARVGIVIPLSAAAAPPSITAADV